MKVHTQGTTRNIVLSVNHFDGQRVRLHRQRLHLRFTSLQRYTDRVLGLCCQISNDYNDQHEYEHCRPDLTVNGIQQDLVPVCSKYTSTNQVHRTDHEPTYPETCDNHPEKVPHDASHTAHRLRVECFASESLNWVRKIFITTRDVHPPTRTSDRTGLLDREHGVNMVVAWESGLQLNNVFIIATDIERARVEHRNTVHL